MKIIEQSHEVLSISGGIYAIEQAGRTCYQSQDKIDCFGSSAKKFVKMLKDKGHHAMLEFGDITVRFITNRGVTHELVRHRMCSFAQESTRYVKYDGQMEFIRPVWCDEKIIGKYPKGPAKNYSEPLKNFILACTNAEYNYKVLIRDGWRPEQAREVLPNSLKTEMVVKANFREWMHILKLRTSKKAHPQIVALMKPLLKEIQEKIPVIFDDI